MGVIVLQILQWILRIILFLVLFILILGAIVLIVPVRYQAEGDFQEKKPGIRGKVTWFFYLIYMKFCYEEEFCMQVRILGFKIFDSAKEQIKTETTEKINIPEKTEIVEETKAPEETETLEKTEIVEETKAPKETETLEKTEIVEETKAPEKTETPVKAEAVGNYHMEPDINTDSEDHKADSKNIGGISETETAAWEEEIEEGTEQIKKSFSEKIEDIKLKLQDLVEKIKAIIAKIQEGKLTAEHYLELWQRKETQITFKRAKNKLGKMIKAVLPRKWKVVGEVGFLDPCSTGQFMGALGAMYPILGNKVQIVPNFDKQIINVEGNVKGHIRLGSLVYQIISLLLNKHCFKFIKLVFEELSGTTKKGKSN